MASEEPRNMPPYDPIILKNTTCVYCAVELTPDIDTKEHVVGRRFVPTGSLDRQWNLIVRACVICNGTKANLENDISAISMQADTLGMFAVEDPVLPGEAERKGARSTSRLTGRAVKDSYQKSTIEVPVAPGAQFTFNLTGLPGVDDERMFELAFRQVQAFFYWITYDAVTQRGGFMPGAKCGVMHAVRSDWGNPAHMAFMKAVRDWKLRVLAIGAKEFFKISIKRHPTAECWSWAVEWNQNFRLVGFFGDQAVAQEVADTFPKLDWTHLPGQPAAFRLETKLDPKDDIMFERQKIAPLSELLPSGGAD